MTGVNADASGATISALSVYSFLRTFSYSLRVSPFEAETFIAALQTNDHNPLLDTVHVRLLELVVENFGGLRSQNGCEPKLFDSFTWTQYLCDIFASVREYFLKLRIDCVKKSRETSDHYSRIALSLVYETEISCFSLVLDMLRRYETSRICYFDFKFADKVAILDALVTVIIAHEIVVDNIDRREVTCGTLSRVKAIKRSTEVTDTSNTSISAAFSRFLAQKAVDRDAADRAAAADAMDSLPLFVKGEDGCLEVCILCGLGGSLVCCDVCPVAYHKHCVVSVGSAKHLEHAPPMHHCNFTGAHWKCFECSTADVLHGSNMLRWNTVAVNPKQPHGPAQVMVTYAVVGRYIMVRDSNGLHLLTEEEKLWFLPEDVLNMFPSSASPAVSVGATEGEITCKVGRGRPKVNHTAAAVAAVPLPVKIVTQWVQCERKNCHKWRKVPAGVDISLWPKKWYCEYNTWDSAVASCKAPEDDDVEVADSGDIGASAAFGSVVNDVEKFPESFSAVRGPRRAAMLASKAIADQNAISDPPVPEERRRGSGGASRGRMRLQKDSLHGLVEEQGGAISSADECVNSPAAVAQYVEDMFELMRLFSKLLEDAERSASFTAATTTAASLFANNVVSGVESTAGDISVVNAGPSVSGSDARLHRLAARAAAMDESQSDEPLSQPKPLFNGKKRKLSRDVCAELLGGSSVLAVPVSAPTPADKFLVPVDKLLAPHSCWAGSPHYYCNRYADSTSSAPFNGFGGCGVAPLLGAVTANSSTVVKLETVAFVCDQVPKGSTITVHVPSAATRHLFSNAPVVSTAANATALTSVPLSLPLPALAHYPVYRRPALFTLVLFLRRMFYRVNSLSGELWYEDQVASLVDSVSTTAAAVAPVGKRTAVIPGIGVPAAVSEGKCPALSWRMRLCLAGTKISSLDVDDKRDVRDGTAVRRRKKEARILRSLVRLVCELSDSICLSAFLPRWFLPVSGDCLTPNVDSPFSVDANSIRVYEFVRLKGTCLTHFLRGPEQTLDECPCSECVGNRAPKTLHMSNVKSPEADGEGEQEEEKEENEGVPFVRPIPKHYMNLDSVDLSNILTSKSRVRTPVSTAIAPTTPMSPKSTRKKQPVKSPPHTTATPGGRSRGRLSKGASDKTPRSGRGKMSKDESEEEESGGETVDQMEVPELEDSSEDDGDGDIEVKAHPVPSPTFTGVKRGGEHMIFATGNRLVPYAERIRYTSYTSRSGEARKRTSVGKTHLRKLARSGGLGFLPHVNYSWGANCPACPPQYCVWRHRVAACSTPEQLSICMRTLEANLVVSGKVSGSSHWEVAPIVEPVVPLSMPSKSADEIIGSVISRAERGAVVHGKQLASCRLMKDAIVHTQHLRRGGCNTTNACPPDELDGPVESLRQRGRMQEKFLTRLYSEAESTAAGITEADLERFRGDLNLGVWRDVDLSPADVYHWVLSSLAKDLHNLLVVCGGGYLELLDEAAVDGKSGSSLGTVSPSAVCVYKDVQARVNQLKASAKRALLQCVYRAMHLLRKSISGAGAVLVELERTLEFRCIPVLDAMLDHTLDNVISALCFECVRVLGGVAAATDVADSDAAANRISSGKAALASADVIRRSSRTVASADEGDVASFTAFEDKDMTVNPSKHLLDTMFSLPVFRNSYPGLPKKLTVNSGICFLPRESIVVTRVLNAAESMVDRGAFGDLYLPDPVESDDTEDLCSVAPKPSKGRGRPKAKAAEVTSGSAVPDSRSGDFYVPQVGDEVMYYPIGHRDYLKSFPATGGSNSKEYAAIDANRRGLTSKHKKLMDIDAAKPSDAVATNEASAVTISDSNAVHWLCCRVLSIDYEFTADVQSRPLHGVAAVLCLGIVNNVHGIKPFYLPFVPDHGCGEFLIRKETLLGCAAKNWQVGEEFSMNYTENGEIVSYTGVVQGIIRKATEVSVPSATASTAVAAAAVDGGMIQSEKKERKASVASTSTGLPVWNGVTVFWHAHGYVDQVNEWELLPAPVSAAAVGKKNKSCGPSAIGRNAATATTASDSGSNVVPNNVRDVNACLLKWLDEFIENPVNSADYGAFYHHVSDTDASGYSRIVPIPMCLTTIRERAAHNFYRQLPAVLNDIRLIYYNCTTYNDANSLLSQRAADLYRALQKSLLEVAKTVSKAADFSSLFLLDYCQVDKLILSDKELLLSTCSNNCPIIVSLCV